MRGRVITSVSSTTAVADLSESRSRDADQKAARIAELKEKLGDEAYMAGAILRIATVLSARITEGYYDGRRKTRR